MDSKDENSDVPSVVITPPRIPSLPEMGKNEPYKQQRRVSDTFDSDMDGDVKNMRGRNEFSSKTSLNGKTKDSRKFSTSSNHRKYSIQDDRDSTCWKISTDRLNVATRRKMSTCSAFSDSIVPPELVLSSCVNSSQDLSQWDGKPKRTSFKSALPEIFASCAATSFHIIVGVTFAATASLLPQLAAEDSDIKASPREVAWIASIFVIVVPFASILSGFIMERFGRLNAVKLAILPSIVSCSLISLATSVEMVIGGRFFMGIGAALGTNPAVVYITEITSPEYRGALVSAGPTLSSLGMMLGYAFGAFLPWRLVSWINIAYCLIPIILIMVLRVPESPVWLVSKNRIDLAKQSLMWINRWEDESTREKNVEKELKGLMKDRDEKRAEAEVDGKISVWHKFSGLGKPTGYKPLIIMLVLFTFQQYTGVYITTFYAVQFFKDAGASMNPFHASILIGLTRFVMSLVTIVLLKKFGRRPLCITSCIGMAVFMGISGYFSYKASQTGEGSMIPVYAILLYVCFCMIGLLSLPWTMAAEVFPTEIRELAHGLVIAGAHIVMFISVQTYNEMAAFFGGHDGLQWFFAIMSILALVFVFFFLPETHRKTLFEIEHYFQSHLIYSKDKIIYIDNDDEDDSNQNIIKRRNYETNIKTAEQTKPIDRKFSMRNVEILAALPENLNEYDTLIKQNEEKYPSIVDKDSKFGNYDLTKIEYIDKSVVELDRL